MLKISLHEFNLKKHCENLHKQENVDSCANIVSTVVTSKPLSTISCKVCKKSFKRMASLEYHILAFHSKRKLSTVTCELCKKGFSSTSNLNKHKRIYHSKLADQKHSSSDWFSNVSYLSLMYRQSLKIHLF